MRLLNRFLGCCLLLPVSAVGAPFQLSVFLGSEDSPIITVPLNPAGEWCLHWHHSVAGFLVKDCFAVDDQGQLFLDASHQPDFAAGLDHIPGRGELVNDDSDGYIIQNIAAPIPGNRLPLRVGSMAVDHRIVAAGHSVSLSEHAADQRVEIRVSQQQ